MEKKMKKQERELKGLTQKELKSIYGGQTATFYYDAKGNLIVVIK